MRESTRYPIILYIAIGLYLLLGISLSAQNWQADLSNNGQPSTLTWRHDTEDFEIAKGWLSLAAPRARGRKIITTNITLGKRMRWQGIVRLDQPTSAHNHAYILLCCYEQDTSIQQYDYLALSIGGGERRSVALVSLRIHWRSHLQGDQRLKLINEQPLVDTSELPEALTQGLRYDVRYSPEGVLALRLLRDQTGRKLYAEQTEWHMTPPKSNSLGIICVYTATRHRGMHFSGLRLDDTWPSQEDDTREEATPSGTPEQALMLSEVMANPRAGAPEYIELYNPNESSTSLESYRLGVGKSRGQLKLVSLGDLDELPAKSYTALSVAPEDLCRHYPDAPTERVKGIALPRLSNTGCLIALYRGEELVDELLYTPDLLERGLKSKRGIALERELGGSSTEPLWRSARARAGYATPAAPNSLEAENELEDKRQGDKHKNIEDLLRLAEEQPKWLLSLHLYTPTGAELWGVSGSTARQWVRRLAHNLGHLHDLPTRLQGQLILVARLSDTSGQIREQMIQRIIPIARP